MSPFRVISSIISVYPDIEKPVELIFIGEQFIVGPHYKMVLGPVDGKYRCPERAVDFEKELCGYSALSDISPVYCLFFSMTSISHQASR